MVFTKGLRHRGRLAGWLVAVWCVFLAAVPAAAQPYVVDCLDYDGKPDRGFGLRDTAFLYEWQATLKSDPAKPPSALTIEYDALRTEARSFTKYRYVILDIESLKWYHSDLAGQYLDACRKATGPDTKWTWWNVAPPADRTTAGNQGQYTSVVRQWRLRREPWVDHCDFAAIAMYFNSRDTVESWARRNLPRIAEAREVYGDKPVFVVLSPNLFDSGSPWPHASGELVGGAIDRLAGENIERIILWSQEGSNRQKWNPDWPWIEAVQSRIATDGRYRKPGSP